MDSISNVGLLGIILFVPVGVGCIVLGMRFMKGKNLQYIAGNANDAFDKAGSGEQKSLGSVMGAVVVGLGVLLLGCAPLCAIFG